MVSTPSRATPYCGQVGHAEGNIDRALLGGNAVSIAKAALSVKDVREAIIQNVLREVNLECGKLCRKKQPTSIFRKIPAESLLNFGKK